MGKISEIEIKDKLYSLLVSKGVDTKITGHIYKDKRPTNSMSEDIWISVLDSDTEQVQGFIVNVNVYVPNIKRGDELIINDPRIRELSAILLEALASTVAGGFQIAIAKQRVMEVNDTPLHVINNRVIVQYCTA